MRLLPNTGTYATIRAMKSVLSENGIPVKVISDNGTHFKGGDYKQFASRWALK